MDGDRNQGVRDAPTAAAASRSSPTAARSGSARTRSACAGPATA
jgi:hypothetical protein